MEEQPANVPIEEERPVKTLRRLFLICEVDTIDSDVLIPFPLRIGQRHTNEEYPTNNPVSLDLDAACFMMLTLNLPSLFGIMARPANRRMKVKDHEEFED